MQLEKDLKEQEDEERSKERASGQAAAERLALSHFGCYDFRLALACSSHPLHRPNLSFVPKH